MVNKKNAELIKLMIEYGDKCAESSCISASTKEERRKIFEEIYYGNSENRRHRRTSSPIQRDK